jgi:ketosteroid isomerase-like protein
VSKENVEIVRHANEARNRGDVEAALRSVRQDVEFDWSESRAAAGGTIEGVIRGRVRFRDLLRELLDLWERVVWDQEEVLEVGIDQVLEVNHVRFYGRDGIELGDRGAVLWTFDGGKAVRLKFFPSKERALEALGRRR